MAKECDPILAGVDEAGRGPLAGPVVAAAVILNPALPIAGLADSKTLSAKQRDALFTIIRKHALAWSYAKASVSEIDRLNIHHATLLAMSRAVNRLTIKPMHILVDGCHLPNWAYSSEAVIDGDAIHASISAASIMAKVIRDRMMLICDQYYPAYGFASHKGYGTKQHKMALLQHGITRIHRQSYKPIRDLCGVADDGELAGE